MTSIAGPKAVIREMDELIAALRAVQPGTSPHEPHLSALLDRQTELIAVMQDSSRLVGATDEELRKINDRYTLLSEALGDVVADGFWREPEQ